VNAILLSFLSFSKSYASDLILAVDRQWPLGSNAILVQQNFQEEYDNV